MKVMTETMTTEKKNPNYLHYLKTYPHSDASLYFSTIFGKSTTNNIKKRTIKMCKLQPLDIVKI